MKLFITGFLQVLFVTINTFFISRQNYTGTVIVGFGISMMWSYNVTKIAFGGLKERLIYSSGAAFGSLLGIYISSLIYKICHL